MPTVAFDPTPRDGAPFGVLTVEVTDEVAANPGLPASWIAGRAAEIAAAVRVSATGAPGTGVAGVTSTGGLWRAWGGDQSDSPTRHFAFVPRWPASGFQAGYVTDPPRVELPVVST